MTVSLSLHLPGTGRVRIERCLVTWARATVPPCSVHTAPRKEHIMKGLSVSLVLGMILIFVLLCGYWLRTPYAISAQWDHSVDRSLEPEDMMRNQAAR
jgi:hypothetical protein